MKSYCSPNPSFSGRRSRLLEVRIKDARVINKHGGSGPFYVKLWIQLDQTKNSKLQTKKVDSKSFTGFTSCPTWNQKFVFAIPHTFVTNDNKISSVWFEIFRVRKGFPDQSLGKAEGKLHLEKTANEEENTNDHNDVCYDSETENGCFYSVEEEEKEEEEACELKGTGSVKVGGRGELTVEMVVWKGFLSRVGDCKWRRWAMEYDEFMGLDQGSVNKNKNKNKNKMMMMMMKKKISALFTCLRTKF